jgi:hypothetical protein
MSKIVRVTGDSRLLLGDDDRRILANHGNIWIWVSRDTDHTDSDPLHNYRSLATGYEYAWYDSEVEPDE